MKNVGGIDRILRIVIGAVLIALVFIMPETFKPWGWIGVIPLVTGIFSFCPFYPLLKIKTSKQD